MVVPAYPDRAVLRIKYCDHTSFSIFFPVISCNPFLNFLKLGRSAWDILGLIFGLRIFGGFVGSPRDFLGGFQFCLHSIIPITWSGAKLHFDLSLCSYCESQGDIGNLLLY